MLTSLFVDTFSRRFALMFAVTLLSSGANVVGAPTADAQAREPSQSEMAMARRLFQGGLAHARAEEWEEARQGFERSYAVAAVPVTLLNLAGAQVQVGQLVAGLESYRNFLSTAGDSRRAARYRTQVQDAIAALEPRLAHLTLRVEGLEPGDELRIGDNVLGQAVLGGDLPVDPGDSEIVVLRAGEVATHERVQLSEGQSRDVTLVVTHDALSPVAAAQAANTGGEDSLEVLPGDGEADDSSIVRSPWLWTGIGVVVVGAVLTGVLVASSSGSSPYRGNLGSGGATFQ